MVVSVKQKIFMAPLFVAFFASIIFGFFIYFSLKETFFETVQYRLHSGINGTHLYLGDDFIDKYTKETPIDSLEYDVSMKKLSDFAQNNGLEYVYLMVKKDNKIYTVISSATQEEIEKKEYDTFMTEYEASEGIINGFTPNNQFLEETIDKYGHFYSLIVSKKSKNGQIYLLGADIEASYINSALNDILLKTIIITIIILVIAILFASFVSNSIGKKIHSTQKGILNFFNFLSRKTTIVEHLDIKEMDEFGAMAQVINENIDTIQRGLLADSNAVSQVVAIANQIKSGKLDGILDVNPNNPQLIELSNVLNDMLKALNLNINSVLDTLQSYSTYDFTKTTNKNNLEGSLGSLIENVNKLGQEITNMLLQNLKNGTTLGDSSKQLLVNVTNLNNASNQAAASLEETAAALEQITSNIRNNRENITKMATLSNNVTNSAQKGEALATQTTLAMDEINTQVSAISDAIAVIDQIAFQTNILSLNAAVEAATAGEAGKGFAVVAGEVRNLANRSADAANEIKALVESAKSKTNQGKDIANDMIKGYGDLSQNISQTSMIISQVELSSKEQLTGIEQINDAVSTLDRQIQANASVASHTTEIAHLTDELAKVIVNDVNRKKFNGAI